MWWMCKSEVGIRTMPLSMKLYWFGGMLVDESSDECVLFMLKILCICNKREF